VETVREAVEGLNLTLVYGGFVLAGLLFCGLVFLFGGDHGDVHAGDAAGDDSGGCFLSPTSLAFFTTSFGAFGLILLHGVGVTPMRSVLYSSVAAAVSMAVLSYAFFRLFVRSGAVVQAENLEGLTAEVYTAIPEEGVGEVLYRDRRGRQKAMARSADGQAIASGACVRIDSAIGPTLVVSRVERND
jgi:membrane protein implicated in regulation of membrane protease activity